MLKLSSFLRKVAFDVLSVHQRNQHGLAKRTSQKYYKSHRSKILTKQRTRYRKIKHSPKVRIYARRYRKNPSKFKRVG